MTRECGTCTKCCEGHLIAQILDNYVEPGNPCKYLNRSCGNCGIYDNRPKVCKEFRCGWLRDDGKIFPHSTKPNVINQIVVYHKGKDETEFYHVISAGEPASENVINTFMNIAETHKLNMIIETGSKRIYVGTDDFKKKYSPTSGLI